MAGGQRVQEIRSKKQEVRSKKREEGSGMKSKKVEKCEILANRKIARDHFVMDVRSEWLGKSSVPGQFVAVSVRDGGTDPLVRIPLGVHKIRNNGISLLYKVVGAGTELLSRKKKGDNADILGPLGNGFDVSPSKRGRTAVLVAGGHGAAPLYALTERLMKKGANVEFFTGACKAEHIVCEKELKRLGAQVHISTDDGSRGKKCFVTDLLEDFLKRATSNERRATIYACGPRPMLAAVSRLAGQYDVAAQVSVDAYMVCGIGACLGCAIRTDKGYKMVCKDGPVFDAGRIVWDEAV